MYCQLLLYLGSDEMHEERKYYANKTRKLKIPSFLIISAKNLDDVRTQMLPPEIEIEVRITDQTVGEDMSECPHAAFFSELGHYGEVAGTELIEVLGAAWLTGESWQ
jgi:hypothetical protein